MDKAERQINLVAMLMGAERPITAAQIRDSLYSSQSDEAFKRMFERDKVDLRELGIRIDLDPIDAWGEEGYAIHRDEATLHDLGLTPAEHAALMLAAQAWGEGELGAGSPRIAGLKLSAVSEDAPPEETWILPRVELSSPNLGRLADALLRRKTVTFSYRPAGAAAATERSVDPHALRHRGAWYLIGLDHSRGEIRHFKLQRIEGLVAAAGGPDADFAPPAPVVDEFPRWDAEGSVSARVAFAPEVAWWAERREGAERVGDASEGWVEISVGVSDPDRFVSWILGFADRAEVLSPEDLREAVTARLRALVSS